MDDNYISGLTYNVNFSATIQNYTLYNTLTNSSLYDMDDIEQKEFLDVFFNNFSSDDKIVDYNKLKREMQELLLIPNYKKTKDQENRQVYLETMFILAKETYDDHMLDIEVCNEKNDEIANVLSNLYDKETQFKKKYKAIYDSLVDICIPYIEFPTIIKNMFGHENENEYIDKDNIISFRIHDMQYTEKNEITEIKINTNYDFIMIKQDNIQIYEDYECTKEIDIKKFTIDKEIYYFVNISELPSDEFIYKKQLID